jgi:hypothetical protein
MSLIWKIALFGLLREKSFIGKGSQVFQPLLNAFI